MPTEYEAGIWSLVPILLSLILAFWTRDAVFSLLFGCVIGVMIAGYDPATGLVHLFRTSLCTDDFIWVTLIELCVGVLVAMYLRTGVMNAISNLAIKRLHSARSAGGFTWIMGLCVFFSDYFSPIFIGPVARPVTDKHRVSREILAYILDSCSAPVCTIIPLSGWAVYIAALLAGHGAIGSAEQGMTVFLYSIPYNLYGWLAVTMAGLIAFQLIPNFGPMRKAELRAQTTGKLLRDGAVPLSGGEFDQILEKADGSPNLWIYFLIPNLIVISIAVGSFFATGKTLILEAFISGILYLSLAMAIGRQFKSVSDGMQVAMNGIKAIVPAALILAAAFSMNTLSKSLGAPQFVLSIVSPWMSAEMLPFVTFATASVISFVTGTSWGTYAIMTPFVLPMAIAYSGGDVSSFVLLTVGALVGGGLSGDHCSPISETACLSSFAAASDHMDHVITQLPYAISMILISGLIYLALGFSMAPAIAV